MLNAALTQIDEPAKVNYYCNKAGFAGQGCKQRRGMVHN